MEQATRNEAMDQRSMAAIKNLAMLQHLTIEAMNAGSLRELTFIILNHTAPLARYDRAFLWDLRGRSRLMGVSGNAVFNANSPVNRAWRSVVASLSDPGEDAVIDGSRYGAANPEEGSALWLPLKVDGRLRAGLCLERFAAPKWTDADIRRLRPLAGAYGAAFRVFSGRRGGVGERLWRLRNLAALLLLAAIAVALYYVRLPLRIVAPCEIVAARPVPVNAPMDGVIREVLARPGQEVAAGDILYEYDGDAALEELEVARKQLDVVRAGLERSSALALRDKEARAEVQLLRNRLAQEQVRFEAAEYRTNRLRVAAPEAGVVVMDDPAVWRGKPVYTGEAVLRLVDPRDNRVRIWLPQEDIIDFRADAPLLILLHADAGRSRRARLTYVANHAQKGPEGTYGFMAEAEWLDGHAAGSRLGLMGTAVLYGDDVPLGYWLLRKPVAAVRRFFGI